MGSNLQIHSLPFVYYATLVDEIRDIKLKMPCCATYSTCIYNRPYRGTEMDSKTLHMEEGGLCTKGMQRV